MKHQQAGTLPQVNRGHSIEETAARIGVSKRTVWRLVKSEKIKAVQVSTRRTIITSDEIDRILAGNGG